MRILFLSPDQNNSTDGIIVRGTHQLLKNIVGDYNYDYCDVDSSMILSDTDARGGETYDLLIVIGTPWLWDGFEKSLKWRNLKRIISLHPKVKIILMGIGSCYFPNLYLQKLNKEAVKEMTEIYDKSLVIVRDSLAERKLRMAGIQSVQLPCPSYFAYGLIPPDNNGKYNVLVWYDPTVGLSRSGWQNKNVLQKYIDTNLDFCVRYNPVVYTHLAKEIPLAVNVGIPKPKLIGGWVNTLNIMSEADIVMSGRVHCAVPAVVAGARTSLLYIDSRSRTLSDYWEGKFTSNHYADILSFLSGSAKTYELIIAKFLEEK